MVESNIKKSIKEGRKDVSKLNKLKKENHSLKYNRKRMDRHEVPLYIKQLYIKIARASINIRRYNKKCLNTIKTSCLRPLTLDFTVNPMVKISSMNYNESLDCEKRSKFWKHIWAFPTSHNRNAELLSNVGYNLNNLERQEISFSQKDLKHKIRKMANWKSPGLEGVMVSGTRKWQNFMERLLLSYWKCWNMIEYQNG